MNTIKMLPVNNSEISMNVEKETEKAVYVQAVNTRIGSFMNVWLPKSQVTINEASFEMPSWLFKKTFGIFSIGINN